MEKTTEDYEEILGVVVLIRWGLNLFVFAYLILTSAAWHLYAVMAIVCVIYQVLGSLLTSNRLRLIATAKRSRRQLRMSDLL